MNKKIVLNSTHVVKAYTILSERYKISLKDVRQSVDKGEFIGITMDGELVGCIQIKFKIDMLSSFFNISVVRICGINKGVLNELILSAYNLSAYPEFSEEATFYLEAGFGIPVSTLKQLVTPTIKDKLGIDGNVVVEKGKNKLVLYSSEYRDKFTACINDYFLERHPDQYIGDSDKISEMLELFEPAISGFIVLSVDIHDEIKSFMVISENTQYDLVDPTLYVEYMYISKKYRSGAEVAMLYAALANMAKKLNMEITSATLTGSSNIKNAETSGAEEYCRMYKFDTNVINSVYDKYYDRFFK